MRYFVFSYQYSTGMGHIFVARTDGKMPNLKETIVEAAGQNASIVSVFEFKNEQDWLDAQGK